MAAVYQSVGTETQTASSTSATANRPAGVADGDLLLMFVGLRVGGVTMTTPAGWTRIVNGLGWHNTGNTAEGYVFWKIAASEPATYSLTCSPAGNWQISVVRVTGTDQVTPINQVATNQTTGASVTSPTVTPTVDNCLIVSAVFQGGILGIGNPGSMTERYDRWYAANTMGQAWADLTQGTAAATGAFTWTQGGTTTRTVLGVTIAIAPGVAASRGGFFPFT